jgi:hypothetical protein
LSDKLRQWALSNTDGLQTSAVNLEQATADFRDHEFAAPRSDWDATWRRWIRTEAKRVSVGAGKKSAFDPKKLIRVEDNGDNTDDGLPGGWWVTLGELEAKGWKPWDIEKAVKKFDREREQMGP